MNDFIVWDEDHEKFIDETKCIFKDGTLFRDNWAFEDMVSEDLTMFWDIGKTDDTPEQNKIYADCSIVEFRITSDIGNTFEKIVGYFRYNELELCYEIIEDLGDNFSRRKWNYSRINYKTSNLKVIGTLQQNKELLEGKHANTKIN